jgi:MHS family proline/betaine transporter-like MFS transporter
MDAWGWRLPFLLGVLLLPVGVYMRRNVDETPAYRAVQSREVLNQAAGWRLAAQAFGFTVLWTVAYYIALSYMPTFTQKFAGLTRTQALWSNTLCLAVLVLAIPAIGHLSDRVGRRPLLLACCVGFVLLPYPLFAAMVQAGAFATVLLVQVAFALTLALFSGPGPAAIAEIFPTRSRTTWMSAGYSLAVAVFGGFAPYAATWLIAATGSPLSPAYYLIGAALISTGVILVLPETARGPLR